MDPHGLRVNELKCCFFFVFKYSWLKEFKEGGHSFHDCTIDFTCIMLFDVNVFFFALYFSFMAVYRKLPS